MLIVYCQLYADTTDTCRASEWFRYAAYGQSLYADEHPDFVRLDIALTTNNLAFDYSGEGKRYTMQTFGNFGARLPIWRGNYQNFRFGLSITQIFNFNIWMDMVEQTTAPIVNTDFRIGVPSLTFIHRLNQSKLSDKNFIKNYSITLFPLRHESTHIGDELVLQRSDLGYALRRVNVSYNYTELNFTLNEPENRYLQTHTFRLGLMVMLQPNEGWYFVEERDGDINNIATNGQTVVNRKGYQRRYGPSGLPFEVYLQYQYQSPCSKHGFQAIVSAEIRNRALYGYSLLETQHSEEPRYSRADKHVFTYNLFVGARYNMRHYDGCFSRFSLGLRAYHGNCPYGMFRSVDNFSHIGLCFIYQ